MGTLYVVSTPIGNLEDLSRRAERVLGSVARVLAEDTRRTGRLLGHLGTRADLVSLHAHNEASRLDAVLGWLEAGDEVALVSDAGAPLVSDPGERIVAAAVEAGHTVVPIPGPSAVIAALVASGLPTGRFVFLGFGPRKGADRRAFLDRVAASGETVVLFESPERLGALLRALAATCGPGRRAAVARELTKLHEEIRRGTLAEMAAYYGGTRPRGEITVVIEPAAAPEPGDDTAQQEDARRAAVELRTAGERTGSIVAVLMERFALPRNLAYRIAQEAKER